MALPVKTESSSLHLRAAGESTSSLPFFAAAGDACCGCLEAALSPCLAFSKGATEGGLERWFLIVQVSKQQPSRLRSRYHN